MSGSVYDDEPMQCRCGDCGALFNVPSPSGLPLKLALSSMTTLDCPKCESYNVHLGQTRTWEEDQALMRCSLTAPVDMRAVDWRRTGEYGPAANAIYRFMTSGKTDRKDVPTDVGELCRCLLLLRRIPEWTDRMGEMRVVSRQWKQFANAWPDLTRLFNKETGEGWLRQKAPMTQDLIDSLCVVTVSRWGF